MPCRLADFRRVQRVIPLFCGVPVREVKLDQPDMTSSAQNQTSDPQNNKTMHFAAREQIEEESRAAPVNSRELMNNSESESGTILHATENSWSDDESRSPDSKTFCSQPDSYDKFDHSASATSFRSFTERPTMLLPDESSQDSTDHSPAQLKMQKPPRPSRIGKKYTKYTPEDRIGIGKHCFEFGPASAREAYRDKYPNMSESVTRGFREKYKAMIGEVAVYEFEKARRESALKAASSCSNGKKDPMQKTPPTISSSRSRENDDKLQELGHITSDRQNSSATDSNFFMPKKYNRYTPETRLRLGRICAEIGPAKTVKRFREEFPSLNGSVVRSFRKKYLDTLDNNQPQVFVLDSTDSSVAMETEMPSMVDVHTHDKTFADADLSEDSHSTSLISRSGKISTEAQFSTESSGSGETASDFLKDQNDESMSPDHILPPHIQPPVGMGSYHPPTSPPVSRNQSQRHFDVDTCSTKETVHFPEAYAEPPPTKQLKREQPPIDSVYPARTPEVYPEQMRAHSSQFLHKSRLSCYEGDRRSLSPHSNHAYPDIHDADSRCSVKSQFSHYHRDQFSSYAEFSRRSPPPYPEMQRRRHSPPYSSTLPYSYSNRMPAAAVILGTKPKQDFEDASYTSPSHYPYDDYTHVGADDAGDLHSKRREKYQKYTPEDRFNIGKLCNEIGLGATVKVYRERFPRLNESVVRTFRNRYRELVAQGNGTPVTETIDRKPSKRSMMGSFESEVILQLRQYKEAGIVLSANLAVAVANQIVAQKGPKYVAALGCGKLDLSKEWATELLWKRKLIDKVEQSSPCCSKCGSHLVCPKC